VSGLYVDMQSLMLSPAAETFPHKLVDKVWVGLFIEMKVANIAFISQLEAVLGCSTIPMVGHASGKIFYHQRGVIAS
jgi:hypothetical protein